ncbi:hypothetical protein K402DRAFT_389659 [Aulographum hederae CBS 113979]|uniref:Pru domain-containing protein n=1 Tax=Aulographum hederae CBS 113979 TaxID=1176131 RepID=A0A6G1HCJ6_9PEZI|nr:hypothetical protein K402DRAFT_389659 [Aulographum hederae CBS 113979]
MENNLIITFKAGRCEFDADSNPPKITADPTPGYIYLYTGDEELVHFCWRPRSSSLSDAPIDLLMIPGDGTFQPYVGSTPPSSEDNVTSPTNGRIFILKFSSSSQRHVFWLQSKSKGAPNWFSAKDKKLGQIVDMLLSGEEVDVQDELNHIEQDGDGGGGDDDGDQEMQDAEPPEPRHDRSGSTGGAGAGATGGDIREEGEEAREGGADGGRAAALAVQNFLKSLNGGNASGSSSSSSGNFTTLPDLLPTSTTIPALSASTTTPEHLSSLFANLPPELLSLSSSSSTTNPADLTPGQQKTLLTKILRSPQLSQSMGSLTAALRDGGLPMVGEALGLGGKVKGGGYKGGMPMEGGEAVEAFLEGVKGFVEEETKKNGEGQGDRMDES